MIHKLILIQLREDIFIDLLDESTILRLNDDSNERYLQARVGNTTLHSTNIY